MCCEFEPTLFKWMAFLTGYVLPKAYYEKVGAEGFEKAPIGSGPYKVDAFERNAFLRLKAIRTIGAASRHSRPSCSNSLPIPPAASPKSNPAARMSPSRFPTRNIDRLKAKPGPCRA